MGIKGDPDKWLFKRLVEAAVTAAPDGGVWRSGKHVILSHPSRNQSPVALHNYLVRLGMEACAVAFDALVRHAETKYDKSVSAAQINLHLDGKSCHKQHRDIYGIDQRDRAGRDCTCSFKPNVATVCYSLGSSRRILLRAETDKFSLKKKCSESCGGWSSKPWLHSGDLMYFNDVWNKSHNHGIPPHDQGADGPVGPRISIALLCAEGKNGGSNDVIACPLDVLKGVTGVEAKQPRTGTKSASETHSNDAVDLKLGIVSDPSSIM